MIVIGDIRLSEFLEQEHITSCSKETVCVKNGQLWVWTTARQVYRDMLGIDFVGD